MVAPAAGRRMVVPAAGRRLEMLVTGSGEPVTVFAHGFAQSIAVTRPLGSGVPGKKIFFQFRGHGRSDTPAGRGPDGRWTYADLADDLLAVADQTGAGRAVGASLGAGALCRLVADQPDRFERIVLFLPAVFDTPHPERHRLTDLVAAVRSGDAARVAELIAAELPDEARTTPAGLVHLRERAADLLRDGLSGELVALTEQVPVPDRAALASVTVPALVLACRHDDLHPVRVAEALADALPRASLHVYDRPHVLWTARADLRTRITTFLA